MSEEMQLELEHTLKTMRELKEAKAEIERLRAALLTARGVINREAQAYAIGSSDRERLVTAAHEVTAALAQEKQDV
jgi:fructoselysine-6-P-deglycase FrlB-like protein